MKIHLPNSASLQNIQGFLRKYSPTQPSSLTISGHSKFIHVHPFALSMVACLAETVRQSGGKVRQSIPQVASLPYLIRMRLFQHLGKRPPKTIREKEETGRFIPITQVRNRREAEKIINESGPLLHTTGHTKKAVEYVLDELLRNSLEHSQSQVGAFFCAQYFSKTRRISIGIADSGVGIAKTISRSHRFSKESEALRLAFQPGISGVRNFENAGAGLFFVRNIAKRTDNYLALYSGNTLLKILRKQEMSESLLNDPIHDRHSLTEDLPFWKGTVIGIDINTDEVWNFSTLLNAIRKHYIRGRKEIKKSYYKGRVKFT